MDNQSKPVWHEVPVGETVVRPQIVHENDFLRQCHGTHAVSYQEPESDRLLSTDHGVSYRRVR